MTVAIRSVTVALRSYESRSFVVTVTTAASTFVKYFHAQKMNLNMSRLVLNNIYSPYDTHVIYRYNTRLVIKLTC